MVQTGKTSHRLPRKRRNDARFSLVADRHSSASDAVESADSVRRNPVLRRRTPGACASLEKIPFIASFGSFIDETSALADLILPDHSPLESWLDDVASIRFGRARLRASRRRR